MPRIAAVCSLHFKPSTRDKKKVQRKFEHDIALAVEKFKFGQTFDDVIEDTDFKPEELDD